MFVFTVYSMSGKRTTVSEPLTYNANLPSANFFLKFLSVNIISSIYLCPTVILHDLAHMAVSPNYHSKRGVSHWGVWKQVVVSIIGLVLCGRLLLPQEIFSPRTLGSQKQPVYCGNSLPNLQYPLNPPPSSPEPSHLALLHLLHQYNKSTVPIIWCHVSDLWLMSSHSTHHADKQRDPFFCTGFG